MGGKTADWRRWQDALAEEWEIKPYAITRFARCYCGTIEHLLMGETGERFWCCECRAMRVGNLIASRSQRVA